MNHWDKADFRRANQQPSYRHLPRAEYLTRTYEFAPKKVKRKFTNDEIIAIRENRKGLTDKQQAEKYGVHPHSIYKIRHRISYANV